MTDARLMIHMIPCYPDRAASLAVARGIVDARAAVLEIQFPFSDPSADGPVIEQACTTALGQGFKVDDGFAFVAEMRDYIARTQAAVPEEARTRIMIMSYASLVVRRGAERFARDCATSGAVALIVPDLPPDCDEGLYAVCRAAGIQAVPVLVPAMSEARLTTILAMQVDYVYCAVRTGITGSASTFTPESLAFLDKVRASGARVLAGFGICEASQVQAIGQRVHAVVVGSALVRQITGWKAPEIQQKTSAFVHNLRSLN